MSTHPVRMSCKHTYRSHVLQAHICVSMSSFPATHILSHSNITQTPSSSIIHATYFSGFVIPDGTGVQMGNRKETCRNHAKTRTIEISEMNVGYFGGGGRANELIAQRQQQNTLIESFRISPIPYHAMLHSERRRGT
jgi:hypothetical protein